MQEKEAPVEEGKKINLRQWVPVESSNIKAVMFDGERMGIRFQSGSEYRYAGITLEIFAGLLSAESKGRFLQSHILGKFEYVRLK